MTKTFKFHMAEISITPADNDQYLISARMKRKQIEVLTSEKSIYELAPCQRDELAKARNISKQYARNIIGYARRQAYILLTNEYNKQ